MGKKEQKVIKDQSIIKEFREFILRGNLVEVMVGLTVGVAFTQFVNSLVNNLILPPIGLLFSDSAFRQQYVPLDGNTYESLQAALDAGAPVIQYGALVADSLYFLIVGIVIFFIVRIISSLRSEKGEE